MEQGSFSIWFHILSNVHQMFLRICEFILQELHVHQVLFVEYVSLFFGHFYGTIPYS